MAAEERPALDRSLQVPCGHVGGARALGRLGGGGEAAARAVAHAHRAGRPPRAETHARRTRGGPGRGPGQGAQAAAEAAGRRSLGPCPASTFIHL